VSERDFMEERAEGNGRGVPGATPATMPRLKNRSHPG
jgi:hypothetical protein